MAPQLKRFFSGLVMFLGGLGAVLLVLWPTHISWFKSNYPTATPITLLLVAVAVIIGVVLFGSACDEAKLTMRWCRLKLGGSNAFPRTKEEREDYKVTAERILRNEANNVTHWFGIRDQAREALDVHLKNRAEGAWTIRLKRTREFQRLYTSHNAGADSLWKGYLKLWDLFRDMGVLPLNRHTNQPWLDPKAFRENDPSADSGVRDGRFQWAEPRRQRQGPLGPIPKPARPEPMEFKKA